MYVNVDILMICLIASLEGSKVCSLEGSKVCQCVVMPVFGYLSIRVVVIAGRRGKYKGLYIGWRLKNRGYQLKSKISKTLLFAYLFIA